MAKTRWAALSVAVALLVLAALTLQAAAQAKPQTNCPVLGGTINKDIYVDYQGQRIYFCCQACIPEFQKDPEMYLEKLKAQGITPEKSPAPGGKSGK